MATQRPPHAVMCMELREQIQRVRVAASQFATPVTAQILADRAERQWRKDFPALARYYDQHKFDSHTTTGMTT